MFRALALCLALLPAAARAGDGPALTAGEFGAIVTGKTYAWIVHGEAFGVERYVEGQRVLWAFLGEQCREGKWYQRGENICFFYPDDQIEQCWRFSLTPTGELMARFADNAESPVYTVSEAPLICPDHLS